MLLVTACLLIKCAFQSCTVCCKVCCKIIRCFLFVFLFVFFLSEVAFRQWPWRRCFKEFVVRPHVSWYEHHRPLLLKPVLRTPNHCTFCLLHLTHLTELISSLVELEFVVTNECSEVGDSQDRLEKHHHRPGVYSCFWRATFQQSLASVLIKHTQTS